MIMQKISRLVAYIAAILCLPNLSASEGWPPYSAQHAVHFALKKKEIESLRDLIQDTDYVLVTKGGHPEEIVSSKDRSVPSYPEKGPAAQSLRKSLEDAGVSTVRLDGKTMYFDPPFDSNWTTHLVFVSYVYSSDRNRPPRCDIAPKSNESGKCAVDLGQEWSMEYRWFPVSEVE